MKKVIVIAASVFMSLTAFAQSDAVRDSFPAARPAGLNERAPHVGVLAGIASPEGSYSSTGELGVDIGYQPYMPFGLGAELTHFKSVGDNSASIERTQLLAKGTYNFGGSIPVIQYSYVGMGAGVAFTSGDANLVAAPLLGFDIPIQEMASGVLTLGALAKYALIGGADTDTLSVNGIVKYWY